MSASHAARLKDKWALVTGSSRGIGQQIALGLAGLGCNVILHGREASHCRYTLESLDAYDIATHVVSGDLATPESIAAIVNGVEAGPGRIDVLYNNAALMNLWKPIWEIRLEEWIESFHVNLFAMIMLCNAFVPAMRDQRYGRVINLTSGIKDTPQLAPYSATKAAVDKYTADLAAELRGTNVLANALDPGWLKTALGGPDADHEVETVLPGALVPVLLPDSGPSGRLYRAQDYSMLDI